MGDVWLMNHLVFVYCVSIYVRKKYVPLANDTVKCCVRAEQILPSVTGLLGALNKLMCVLHLQKENRIGCPK